MTNHPKDSKVSSGIALPIVLIIMAALMVLALAAISLTGIEHQTSRAWVDQSRAKLAVQSGREEVEALMQREMANDDFILLQADGVGLPGGKRLNAPYGFLFS
jgi:Tfp pilus assembly protein PilX